MSGRILGELHVLPVVTGVSEAARSSKQEDWLGELVQCTEHALHTGGQGTAGPQSTKPAVAPNTAGCDFKIKSTEPLTIWPWTGPTTPTLNRALLPTAPPHSCWDIYSLRGQGHSFIWDVII